MSKREPEAEAAFLKARDEFVAQWGALGTQWGINRTMAQIHALLLVSPKPLCTDDIMDTLQVSRGNANTNLHGLVDWGLIRNVVIIGERKDYYEAEKDIWTIFCAIARERRRREIEPALKLLESCAAQTHGLKSLEAKAFHEQITALAEFVSTANSFMSRIAESDQNTVLSKAIKWLV